MTFSEDNDGQQSNLVTDVVRIAVSRMIVSLLLRFDP